MGFKWCQKRDLNSRPPAYENIRHCDNILKQSFKIGLFETIFKNSCGIITNQT